MGEAGTEPGEEDEQDELERTEMKQLHLNRVSYRKRGSWRTSGFGNECQVPGMLEHRPPQLSHCPEKEKEKSPAR